MVRSWSINGRFLSQNTTGVQRYAHEVLRALDQHLAEGHPLTLGLDLELLVPERGPGPPPLQAIRIRIVDGALSGHAWEQIVLPAQARHGLLSLCNTGPVLARKHIVCIHDVNTRVCPSSYTLPFRALYRGMLPVLGQGAAAVATVSRYSADQLVRFGIAKGTKIFVAPNGHEHVLRWEPRHSPTTREYAGRDTVLVLGSPARHKNVGLVFGLASELAAAGLRIAVVGSRDGFVFSTNQVGPADNVNWLGRLSDAQLAALLQDCLCLAFPSLSEGFGLPVLEAMALGCPVVASDQTSLPEVCGDAALLASAHDRLAWLASLLRLQHDQGLRQDLVRRGRLRAAAYSWSDTAQLYLQQMYKIDGLGRQIPTTHTRAADASPSPRPSRDVS
jgi:glycosyltransferase involved in cell wall biosynthesis